MNRLAILFQSAMRGRRRALALLCLWMCGPSSVAALEWHSIPEGRWAEVAPTPSTRVGFTPIPARATGILFSNLLDSSRYLTNQIFLNGSGVALGDVDGDGWCDLFFAGLGGRSTLYRNLGNWRFEDITVVSGVSLSDLDATGAVLADIDGDGDLDLVVNSIGRGTVILLNDGKGHFEKSTVNAGLNERKGGMSLALADVDGDGDLDLYIANYRTVTLRDQPETKFRVNKIDGKLQVLRVNDRPVSEPDLVGRFTVNAEGKIKEHGEADLLLLNDGHGKFAPVSFTAGAFLDEDGKALTEPPYDWGLSVMFRDLNGDGAPDLYVCNDFESPDRIWLNTGDGHFRAIPRLALRHTSMFSMGVDVADINRDGYDDFFVADMLSPHHQKKQLQIANLEPQPSLVGRSTDRPQYSRNMLFLNRGDGTYQEQGLFSGVSASEWSWTPVFLDVDLDGFEDLLISTGHEMDMMNADVIERASRMNAQNKFSELEKLNLRKMFARLDLPKVAYRNLGNGRFEEVGRAWGFDARGVTHGMALGDLDNDGDLDVVMNNLNGAAGIYRNEGSGARVTVRLKGRAPNTRGIGAKIKLHGGAVPMQSQEVQSGGRYLSGDEPVRTFAAGQSGDEMRIEVRWRSGKRTEVKGVRANRVYEIEEPSTATNQPVRTSPGVTATKAALFEDVSLRIGHRHHEESFDDFERQPLLPRRLSQLGPGVAWQDVDGDGREDLVIGTGRGGVLGVYRNDGKGGFAAVREGADRVLGRDQTAVVGLEGTVLVGLSNYEDGRTNGGCVRIYDLERKSGGEAILGQSWGRGPLALGDMDGDGDLDLFVGGRVVAGRYPEAADSLLMRNEGGRFVVAQRLEKLGLVSGAAWSDLDGDGQVELVLACEWGPVRVFRRGAGGKYEEATRELGLEGYTGWWNGVTTGDVDGDGRLDIVASNWGWNSGYEASAKRPARLYYGDYGHRGGVDLVEARYDEELGKEVPLRGLKAVAQVMPWVFEKFSSFEAYGGAGVGEIFGEELTKGTVVEARVLSAMVFLNRGKQFEGRALPAEAQMSPSFGVNIGDMDGDGKEDVFLSQNFFAVNAEGWRSDGGRGLWLRGDGKGNLEPVSGEESGVKVYGEQRGSALGDYDGDGRVDLVVTQNGEETKLYHNVGAKPGLRVRLKGAEGNVMGVGASMRLVFAGGMGPVREVHAGSGYWSQDGAVQVMGTPEEPTEVWVRWSGGKTFTAAVPAGAKEIVVDQRGTVRAIRR